MKVAGNKVEMCEERKIITLGKGVLIKTCYGRHWEVTHLPTNYLTPLNSIYRVVISQWLTQYSQLTLTIQHPARRPRRVERVVGMCPSGSTTWLTGGKGQTQPHKALVTIPDSVSHSMIRIKSEKTREMETNLNVLYSISFWHFGFSVHFHFDPIK